MRSEVAQIKPILEKLKEQYPDQAGVLHLENYEADSASINFTPAVLKLNCWKKTKNKKKSIDYLRKRLYYILIELYRSIKIRDV